MVHFFGILSPAFGNRVAAKDTPYKAYFFSKLPGAMSAERLSRAEHDACYLAGKAPEPDLEQYTPPGFTRSIRAGD